MMRMSFRKQKPINPASPASVTADIAWEYDDETAAYRRPGSRPAATPTPATSDARAQRVRRALDAALDEWWRRGVLPADELLREGLLVLEAGHDLDESQRTLLLRAALARRRGMLTALRHQNDPERTAVVLEDALFQATPPLSPGDLARLHQSDAQSTAWAALLSERLRTVAATDSTRRSQATAALTALHAPAPLTAPDAGVEPAAPLTPAWIEGEVARQQRRHWLWLMGVAATVAVVAAAIVWWQRTYSDAMIDVPAGSYTVTLQPGGAAEVVELAAFRIDRFEATVADYRRCYERGACPWPATTASATRPGYLLDPVFSRFPMINLDYDSASRFCRFMGKRLPTAAEWEVAAAFAPATNRMYRYPWGDEFAVQRANSAALGIGDTMQVGAFRPAGDSALGASDMAGNVAEWTATAVAQDGATLYLVKGGAFVDAAEKLRTAASIPTAPRASANWLGTRCAADRR